MFRQLTYSWKGCQIMLLFKAVRILSTGLKMIVLSEAGESWAQGASALPVALRRE